MKISNQKYTQRTNIGTYQHSEVLNQQAHKTTWSSYYYAKILIVSILTILSALQFYKNKNAQLEKSYADLLNLLDFTNNGAGK